MDDIDPWDSLLDVESRMYEDGYREGQEAAIKDGIIQEGTRAGFMKGFAIALEIAFMETVVKTSVEKASEIKDEIEGENNSQAAVTNRLDKRRRELMYRCSTLPDSNVYTLDFAEEVRQIRTMYKQCNTGIEFAPRKVQEAAPTQEW